MRSILADRNGNRGGTYGYHASGDDDIIVKNAVSARRAAVALEECRRVAAGPGVDSEVSRRPAGVRAGVAGDGAGRRYAGRGRSESRVAENVRPQQATAAGVADVRRLRAYAVFKASWRGSAVNGVNDPVTSGIPASRAQLKKKRQGITLP